MKKLTKKISNDKELGEAIRKEIDKEMIDGIPKYKKLKSQ